MAEPQAPTGTRTSLIIDQEDESRYRVAIETIKKDRKDRDDVNLSMAALIRLLIREEYERTYSLEAWPPPNSK